MKLSDLNEYLESSLNEENEYNDYYDKYGRIQVIKEAVENKFIDGEIDYEEYTALIDRLDEREIYIESELSEVQKQCLRRLPKQALACAVFVGMGELIGYYAARQDRIHMDKKMRDEFDKIDLQLNNLAAQRMEIIKQINSANKSLTKAKDDVTIKALESEIKKGEAELKRIESLIKNLVKKADAINKKLEKYKNKKSVLKEAVEDKFIDGEIDYEEYTALTDSLDEKVTKESVELEKIQVLREAVEDKFIDGEIDYEEYEALTNRLDEKEMYLEANRYDEYNAKRIKKEYGDISTQEELKNMIDGAKRVNRAHRHAPSSSLDEAYGNYVVDNLFSKKVDRDGIMKLDGIASNIHQVINTDSRIRNSDDFRVARNHAMLSRMYNKKIDEMNDKIKQLTTQRENAMKANKDMVMRLKEKNDQLKKDHKLAMAGIAAATAVGAGAGALAVMVAKRNNDVKMCDDLDKIQAQLTDLGTQRTEVVAQIATANKSLTKAKDNTTVKALESEVNKGETLLKKIDSQIKSLTRKAEVIGKKLEKYKNKK